MASSTDPAAPLPFSAHLTPHCALSSRAFAVVMAVFGGFSLILGLFFWSQGAWPVFGFFGLDVVALYIAFRVSFKRAAAFEDIVVTYSHLAVRQVSARGRRHDWSFNPLWVSLEKTVCAEFGLERLALRSRGRQLVVGAFLSPDERSQLADALQGALVEARRGPRLS